MNRGMKYGLQLRGPQSATAAKKPLPPPKKPSIFNQDEDDEEDTVEQAIARQAAKKRALKEVELQHKAALEQDSTVFAYDEVYDDMKATSAPSRKVDPEQNKPKYITKLLDKAKARQQEQEIIYERRLLKEREREDHLYGDKDKFVTTAYKQKLAEQAKWIEEERLRELREQAEEVTNRSDLSDFYHNLLSKNVAFGAGKHKTASQELSQIIEEFTEAGGESRNSDLDKSSEQDGQIMEVKSHTEKVFPEDKERGSPENLESEEVTLESEPDAGKGSQSRPGKDVATEGQQVRAEHKPSEDALAAAKARFLARKRMRTT